MRLKHVKGLAQGQQARKRQPLDYTQIYLYTYWISSMFYSWGMVFNDHYVIYIHIEIVELDIRERLVYGDLLLNFKIFIKFIFRAVFRSYLIVCI